MKRTLILLFSALFCLSINGISQKTTVGVTGGLVVTNQYGEIDGTKYDFTSKTGFTLGLVMDAPIGKTPISFMPSVNYVQKGAVLSEDEVTDVKITRALRYAEFEFNFIAKTGAPGGTRIFGGVGPTFAMNLPSKTITNSAGTKTEENVTFGEESPAEMKGLDYGFNLIAGLMFKDKIVFSANYTHGVRNLSLGEDDGDRLWNSCFAVKLGLMINNK